MENLINPFFKIKFPFAYNYFTELLDLTLKTNKKFPQALIFEGAETEFQYLFALELARILNCEKDRENSCSCINCKWIKSYSHPAINIVSEIHFKGDDDESKTVISVKQARKIEQALTLSSDYHRFFIFFSSKEKQYEEGELDSFLSLGYSDDIDYSFEPLTYKTFHPTTPNALLKSIEEPPNRTTFVFLTKSKEDILPTIVSRCQVFKLNSKKQKLDYNDILPLFSKYPNIDYISALDIAENILRYSKEGNQTTAEILNKILEYLKDLIKRNQNSPNFYLKAKKDIDIINNALKCLSANMQDKVVLEAMMLKIARGY